MSHSLRKTQSTYEKPPGARIPVGIWAQWPTGARWSNEGMTRLLGFLIEGIAKGDEYVFRLVLPDSIREAAETDLAGLAAIKGVDYSVHSPGDAGKPADDPESLARFANDHMIIAGWISIFPSFSFAKLLKEPVTTIFPDAIPTVFHEFGDITWGETGTHISWRNLVFDMLATSCNVITFSKHVADLQANVLFGVHPNSTTVVPHASPDLSGLLPFLINKTKTKDSVNSAADILRRYVREKGMSYLYDYAFEDNVYIAVSTQDRVTKNLTVVAEALKILSRESRISIKVMTTAILHFGAGWTPLPAAIETAQIQLDFVSLPDLPRDVHAAFHHCATVAVHPSFFEGGHAPFPFYEAVSVGTPCLVARGPHVAEFAESHPDMAAFTFDPNDASGLAALIERVIDHPSEAIKRQQTIYARLATRGWDAVAAEYAKTATAHRTTV